MRPPRLVYLLASTLLTVACNPNFGMGSGAVETPPEWKGPSGPAGHEDNGVAPGVAQLLDQLLEKAKADPADLETRKQLGEVYIQAGQWDEAAKVLGEAEALAPKDLELKVTRARVLLRKHDAPGAKAELDAATMLGADDEKVLREWSEYYIVADQPDEAAKMSKRLLATHPDLADAELVERQMFYLSRIKKLEADKTVGTFFQIVKAAAQLASEGKDAEAAAKYQAGLALVPDDPYLLSDLGIALRKAGKNKESNATLRKALSIDKNNSHAREELARDLSADGDSKGALAVLKEWQKIDARRAKAHDADGLIASLEKGESIARPAPNKGTEIASAGNSGHPGTPGAVRGTVTLSPALAGKIPTGATFFIFAKAGPGGPPAAAHREPQVPAFPYPFQLSGDDNMMAPGTPLSGSVFVTARISIAGGVVPGPGDMEGVTATAIPAGTDGIQIVIDKVRGADNQLKPVDGSVAVAPATPAPDPVVGAGGSTVTGTVDVDPSLRSHIPASATLFVFAKSSPGPGMPLAVHREPVSTSTRFPLPFSLSQAENPMPMAGNFAGPVYITARISVSGMAGAAPGDLEGAIKSPVMVGTQGVKVPIDTVR